MATRSLREFLAEPQIITLAVVFFGLSTSVYFFGQQLAPFAIALVFAYFLDGGVQRLRGRWRMGRGIAVGVVFGLYLMVYTVAIAGPLQLVMRRSLQLAGSMASQADEVIQLVRRLPDPTFGLVPAEQREEFIDFLVQNAQEGLNITVSTMVQMIPQFTGWVVYLFIIPLLVFFFLRDKEPLIHGVLRCLPRNRELVSRIWIEMEPKMGNYVRGKMWEILAVGVVTWLALWLLGFQYPVVLGALSGISVLIPYVGAIAVAVPVFVIGYTQWGLTWELGWVMIVYTAIQMIDGNVLVPLIFSEAVQLHPVLILLAVFVFGSLWGLWGVFFAIPLATLMKSVVVTILDFRERLARDQGPAAAGGA